MDTTSSSLNISPEYRSKIYAILAQIMLDGFENGSIHVDDSHDVAQFLLDNLDNVQTHEELQKFLNKLCEKWPAFTSALIQIPDEGATNEKIDSLRTDLNKIIQ